jgi:hypothetical protein
MQIPPWLDVSPSQFVQAREAGVRAGQENAQLGQQGDLERARLAQERDLEGARISQQGQMEGARLAQSAAEAAQQLGLAKQRLEAQQKQTAMEFQAGQETAKQNFMLRQTQDAVANAYKQAQIGLGNQKLDLAGQKLKLDVQTVAAKTATATSKPDPIAMKQFDTVEAAYLNAVKEYQKAKASTDPNVQSTAGDLARIAKNYSDRADKLAASMQGPKTPAAAFNAATATGTTPGPQPASAALGAPAPTPAAGGPAPAAPSSPGLPKQGDVINGYVFKGGDPADQKNWMEAPSQPSPVQ